MKPQLVWQQLKRTFEFVEQQVAKELDRKHGIGLTEYRALQLLSEAPNSELRMQEIAQQLGLNQSSVTRLAERMERQGYTTRDVCPNDKRGVYAVITKRGRQTQIEVDADYDRVLEAAINSASQHQADNHIAVLLRNIVLGRSA